MHPKETEKGLCLFSSSKPKLKERKLLTKNGSELAESNQGWVDDFDEFTLTYHPHNLAAENIILKNFKLLQNDN